MMANNNEAATRRDGPFRSSVPGKPLARGTPPGHCPHGATPAAPSALPALLTRDEVARVLGVTTRSIDNYIRAGHLRVVRKPRHGRRMGTFIRPVEIERFQRGLVGKGR